MKTYTAYLNEAGQQLAKWVADKKKKGNVVLKGGTKQLFRMWKSSADGGFPYVVKLVLTTTRKNAAQSFKTFKEAMSHVNRMVDLGILGDFSVEPMPKDVQDWLEQCAC